MIYTVPMSDAENHSLQHESLLKMQSGQLYLSQVQNYSDLGIVPALVLCMRTFQGMQAHILRTEITLFPHHQEQNYVNDIIGGGRGGNTQISSKNFKIACKLLCPQVSQPLDIFFETLHVPYKILKKKPLRFKILLYIRPGISHLECTDSWLS